MNTKFSLTIKMYKQKAFNEFWGEAEERLSLYILRTFPHIDEHVETRPLYTSVMPNIEQVNLFNLYF